MAHDCTLDCDPTYLPRALLIAGYQSVFCPTLAASTSRCREGSVQLGKILWVNLRAHLRKSLLRRIQAMPVNVPISDVIFEAPTFQVEPPGTKFGTIQRHFQPVIGILKRCLLLPPLGEQRGKH